MERKIVFSVSQFKELAAEPRLAVALVKVLDGDMSLPVVTALAMSKALLKQFDLFEAGVRIQFDAFEVANADSLTSAEVDSLVDGSASMVIPPVNNPLPDDLSKAERKLITQAIADGLTSVQVNDLIMEARERARVH
jgi:uncharacterized protein with von Willebrand factor type A (vWA) domain